MDINIRPAQLSDVESIFIVRTSVTENHLSREEMREMGITESTVSNMIEEGRCAWVATYDNEVVGFSMILRGKGSLFGLFVLPTYEGRGIGRRLTKIAEQELFKHHDVAWLETDGNSRAAKFYMQLGWTNKTTLDGDFIRFEKQRDS
ncbi:GNAT family N-acetyltransferase [Citrobacter freundii]|uniref:GNAT family N-acetyltransferase n=2 Tax=Citrobacter freundii TaxID=546 RepID=UPI0008FD77FD|nr:GNAT family N-acetyltransferase [Citrobacter freundii]EKW7212009.1 GNAT family N-acetyltransferase [Citrobacter freundii]ELO0988764.1 GNAT family N-acetyltransferase [Citrobacter freundii]MDE8800895.1 GNAT family N-acetyltransferase [Citrobacter freundii]MDE8806021.1 GNAT family N-acetyltransferase [Citrobacter freundii]OIZ41416.1 GNAT family N-acetyltransferase [Citrobacter freundii]